MGQAAWLVAAMLLSLPQPASAEDCDGTTAQMIACGSPNLDRADAELNGAYKVAMQNARAMGFADKLRNAQRLWIPFRDAACAAEAAPHDGGSIQPLIRIGCLTGMTEQRTQDLRRLFPY